MKKLILFHLISVLLVSYGFSQPSMVSFQPKLSYVFEGQSSVQTVPTPLTITLNSNPETDQFIQITSSNTTALQVIGGGTTIPAGSLSGIVIVNALSKSESVTLTASLNGKVLNANIRVVAAWETPVLDSISPKTCVIQINENKAFTAFLNIPAPTGGTLISLSSNGGIGTLPIQSLIPAKQISGSFIFNAGSAPASGGITGILGSSSASALVDIVMLLSDNMAGQDINNPIWFYPNPATDHIIVNNNTRNIDALLTISNSIGQIVVNKSINGSKVYINLRDYERGIYFISLFIGSRRFSNKLVLM